MGKTEFIKAVAEKADVTQIEAKRKDCRMDVSGNQRLLHKKIYIS